MILTKKHNPFFILAIHSIAMLIYLFCDGKTEDNLGQVRNKADGKMGKLIYPFFLKIICI